MKYILFLLTLPAIAQNPFSPAFPTGIVNLPVANNGAKSTLTSAINNSTLSIPVLNSLLFVVPTIVTIDTENIFIGSKTGNTLNATQRGFGGTAISAHAYNASVNGYVSSEYFNMAAAEITSIESHFGSHSINQTALSVKDFGCVGDGTTNDTACLVATYTYCVSLPNSCEIYFPPGRYKTHKFTVQPLASAGMQLVGAGQRQSTLVGYSGEEILYMGSGSLGGADNARISDMSFDCSAGSTIGLHVGLIGDGDFHNLFAYGCSKYAIVFDHTVNSNIQNIAAWGNGTLGGAALAFVNNANGNLIKRIEVDRWNGDGLYIGDDSSLPGFAESGGQTCFNNVFVEGIIECNGPSPTCNHISIAAEFNNAASNTFYSMQFGLGDTDAKTGIKFNSGNNYANRFYYAFFFGGSDSGNIYIDNGSVFNQFYSSELGSSTTCSNTHIYQRYSGMGLIFNSTVIAPCNRFHYVTTLESQSVQQINPYAVAGNGVVGQPDANTFWLHGISTPFYNLAQNMWSYIKDGKILDMYNNDLTGYGGVYAPIPKIVFGIGTNPNSLAPYSTWASSAFPTQYVGTIFINTTLGVGATTNLVWIFNGFAWILVK